MNLVGATHIGGGNMVIDESVAKRYYVILILRGDDQMKKYPRIDLDDVARECANGHYVEQSPIHDPERDKMISEAIAKIKTQRPAAKARQ